MIQKDIPSIIRSCSIFLPGGLGATELSMISLLLFFTSITSGIASGATIIIRIATLWLGVLFGMINYLIFLKRITNMS